MLQLVRHIQQQLNDAPLTNEEVNLISGGVRELEAAARRNSQPLPASVAEMIRRENGPFVPANGGAVTLENFRASWRKLEGSSATAAYDVVRMTWEHYGSMRDRTKQQEATYRAANHFMHLYYGGRLFED